jgi:predicted DNA-binding protein with PD1-like motif
MRTRVFRSGGRRVLVVVADKGDEAIASIHAAVERHELYGGQVTAVGAFRSAELGYFDRARLQYDRIEVADQVEMLSLLGDIAQHHNKPVVHLHTVLGRRDGSTVGGHLLSGQVWPTLEIIVTEVAVDLVKHLDPQTGLALLPAQPDEGA